MRRWILPLLGVLVAAECGAAAAQTLAVEPVQSPGSRLPAPQPTYGIQSQEVTRFRVAAMTAVSSEMKYFPTGYGISCGSAECTFLAPLNLPSGALVTQIELTACDDDPDAEDDARAFFGAGPPDAGIGVLASVSTSDAPGCITLTAPVNAVIDNGANYYVVGAQVRLYQDYPYESSLGTASVYWRRQVSQPPESATFGDVATDNAYFAFVEALAASGIASECAPGRFCPDNPVTRAQLAMYLGRALGLHFGY